MDDRTLNGYLSEPEIQGDAMTYEPTLIETAKRDLHHGDWDSDLDHAAQIHSDRHGDQVHNHAHREMVALVH